MKPANILFNGEDHSPVLADFGICLIRDLPRATDTGEVVGPRAFMAPELEDGGKLDVTAAADVYSLGKVLYFMLSGGTVLPRERHAEDRYNFSAGDPRLQLMWILFDRMICMVNRRIQTMNEVSGELRRIQNWTTTSAPKAPLPSEMMKRLADLANADQQKMSAAEAYEQAEKRRTDALEAYLSRPRTSRRGSPGRTGRTRASTAVSATSASASNGFATGVKRLP